MPTSFAKLQSITCPKCSKNFEDETWLIIDPSEKPDLVEKIKSGILNKVTCPKCGAQSSPSNPLLVFRRDKDPHIFYIPSEDVKSRKEFKQDVEKLLKQLRTNLGDEWRDSWEQNMQTTSHRFLWAELSDNKVSTLEQQAKVEMEHLYQDDPETFQMMAKMFQSNQLQAVMAFTEAETWEETVQVIEQNPQLLSDEAKSF